MAEVQPPASVDLGFLTEIPKIITDLGWVGVAMLVAYMFATNRWYSGDL